MSNIVLVEDQPRPRQRIVGFLTEDGYSVRDFGDAGGALGMLDRPDAHVDLMIVDWDLAGKMSGSELLLRLKQRNAPFPRIVVSPSLTLKIRNRAIALGAVDLVLRPVDRERLTEAVGQALEDPKRVDPLVERLRKPIVGESRRLLNAVVKLAQAIQSADMAVLLIGESGVGKEVFAQLLHQERCGADAPIEDVNLAGLSSTLIESELFGHEKGAFTGAEQRHIGAFERANKGTLFLDEIGYLESSLQPKLLRAIAQRKFLRVGGSKPIAFEANLVCATSRNLAEAVKTGVFRRDLYHRISEFEIRIPPLRDRKEDLRPLADHFLQDSGLRLARETLEILKSYSFPGNVRELCHILNYARAVCRGTKILPADLPGEIMHERESPAIDTVDRWPESLFARTHGEALNEIQQQFDRVYLLRRIQEAGDNRERAAKLMGFSSRTLRDKLKACGLGHLVRGDEGDT